MDQETKIRFAEEQNGDTKDIDRELKGEKREPLDMDKVISPEHLKIIASSSGGFTFRPDPSLEQLARQTGTIRLGYTDMNTRVIYYNPIIATGMPETVMEPWSANEVRGFFYHEAGHHAPEVKEYQDRIINHLKHVQIPEAYRGDPQSEKRFYQAVYSNVINAVADIWDESYMGRKPYNLISKDIASIYSSMEAPETYKTISKPQQMLQAVLRHRYTEDPQLKEKVDVDAYQSFQNIIKSGALKAVMDWRPYGYLASDRDKKSALERKVAAYEQVFLPEYLKLMEAELEKRKDERKKQKQQEQQDQQGQKGQQGKGQRQEGEGGASQPSEDVPLTREEEQEIIDQILKELEEAGKDFGSKTMSEEEKERAEEAMKEIGKEIESRHNQEKEGKKQQAAKASPKQKEKSGADALSQRADALRQKEKELAQRGLAEAMQTTQESIQSWERIKQEYSREIESTASALSEIFLDDRRKKIEYLRREGEVVPGLEFEHVAATLSGELDPDTKMRMTRNPEFLRTQLEFIVDTSGSMEGEKIQKSIDTTVIITEGFKKTVEDMEAENLVMPEEQPFEVGVSKYSTTPERVTSLSEPLDDKKEIKIIEHLSKVGGGTDETLAVKEVYEQLALERESFIKIIVMFTDGQGNREGIAPIMQQIEDDDQVIFLVIGFGGTKEEADEIVNSYIEPLIDKNKNVYGFATDNPATALPHTLEVLKREVEKRRQF